MRHPKTRGPAGGSRRARRDGGFTLIELLVVVIIIGILAAVGVPILMRERAGSFDAQAKSDLRNLATEMESYFAANDHYSATRASFPGFQSSPHSGVLSADGSTFLATVRLYDRSGADTTATEASATGSFCIATVATSGNVWVYNSRQAGLRPRGTAGCPATNP